MKRWISALVVVAALTAVSGMLLRADQSAVPTTSRNILQVADVLANDSDKTFTVPAGRVWRVLSIYVKLVTTATAGNRGILYSATDAADAEILSLTAALNGVVQAASLTRYYTAAPGLAQHAIFNTDKMMTSLSDSMILRAGYKLRVRDGAAIDIAADDMDVRIMVEESIE